MRFYFHLVGPTGATPDDAGLDACSLEVAEAESRQAMQEIRDDDMFAGEDWDGWQRRASTGAARSIVIPVTSRRSAVPTPQPAKSRAASMSMPGRSPAP